MDCLNKKHIMVILKSCLIVIASILVCLLIKKLIESIVNLKILFETAKHPERYPDRINRGGFVINKKTKKVEADNHIKLPF